MRLLPTAELRIEPYAVLYGGFRLEADTFSDVFSAFGDDNHLHGVAPDSTVLSLSIDDKTSESVKLSWTYSRPARDPADTVFRPKRAVEAANDIPPDFFMEGRCDLVAVISASSARRPTLVCPTCMS